NDCFLDKNEVVKLISSMFLSHLLGIPVDDENNTSKGTTEKKSKQAAGIGREGKATARTRGSRLTQRYTGRFSHPANGDLNIGLAKARLTFEFAPLISGELVHEAGDTFRLRFDREHWHDDSIAVTFCRGPDAQARSLTLTVPPMRPHQSPTSWIYR